VGKCHRIASVGGRGWVRLGHQVGAGSVTRSGREVIAVGWVGGLVGGWLVVRAVIKSVALCLLWGRDLARGRADPTGFPNRTVRGKQTAQTANAVRLR
jgi:hypothetical protein